MNSYVAGFALDRRREEVLLIRKNRPAWQMGKLNGVGGKVEGSEFPSVAMKREFHEEADPTGTLQNFIDFQQRKTRNWVGWRHFLTLEGPNDEFYGAATPGPWVVYFFRAHVPVDLLLQAAENSPTDEQLVVIPASLVNSRINPLSVVPNLRWILPMAFYNHEHEPVTVREKVW